MIFSKAAKKKIPTPTKTIFMFFIFTTKPYHEHKTKPLQVITCMNFYHITRLRVMVINLCYWFYRLTVIVCSLNGLILVCVNMV
jgi:hypothetical protein